MVEFNLGGNKIVESGCWDFLKLKYYFTISQQMKLDGGGGWESLVRKNMHQRAKPNFYSTCFGKNTQPSCKTPTNCGGQSLRAEIFILKTEKREKKNPNSTNKKQPT